MSTPGLIGAVAGLVFAGGIFFVMSMVWQMQSQNADTPAEERERFAKMWPFVRLLLIGDFVVMAVVGYFAGEAIGS